MPKSERDVTRGSPSFDSDILGFHAVRDARVVMVTQAGTEWNEVRECAGGMQSNANDVLEAFAFRASQPLRKAAIRTRIRLRRTR
jgi:hypothetical protein